MEVMVSGDITRSLKESPRRTSFCNTLAEGNSFFSVATRSAYRSICIVHKLNEFNLNKEYQVLTSNIGIEVCLALHQLLGAHHTPTQEPRHVLKMQSVYLIFCHMSSI